MKFPLLFMLLLTAAATARADILVLESGKTLKIESYTIEGATMRADLNDKGEIAIPIEWVREIRPSPPEPKPQSDVAVNLIQNLDLAYSDLVRSFSRKH